MNSARTSLLRIADMKVIVMIIFFECYEDNMTYEI